MKPNAVKAVLVQQEQNKLKIGISDSHILWYGIGDFFIRKKSTNVCKLGKIGAEVIIKPGKGESV